MSGINYERKYKALLGKFMNAVRRSFEMGFEAGSTQAQMQATEEKAATAQMMGQQGPPGQEQTGQLGNPSVQPGIPTPGSASMPVNGSGDEEKSDDVANPIAMGNNNDDLVSSLHELQGIVSKGEVIDFDALQKSIEKLSMPDIQPSDIKFGPSTAKSIVERMREQGNNTTKILPEDSF